MVAKGNRQAQKFVQKDQLLSCLSGDCNYTTKYRINQRLRVVNRMREKDTVSSNRSAKDREYLSLKRKIRLMLVVDLAQSLLLGSLIIHILRIRAGGGAKKGERNSWTS